MRRTLPVLATVLVCAACTAATPALTDSERIAIGDSATAMIRAMWDAGQALDAKGVFNDFTRDADGRIVEEGRVIALDEAIREYTESYRVLASLSIAPTSRDVVVPARDTVLLTAPSGHPQSRERLEHGMAEEGRRFPAETVC